MKIIISGKNLSVSPALENSVREKLGKLDPLFDAGAQAQVTLCTEKNRQKAEITIPVRGRVIRSEQVTNDLYLSIDLAVETIGRQMRKYRDRIHDHRSSGIGEPEKMETGMEPGQEIKIVRDKQFDIKPMYPEDACVQMELLGHDFYVFVNAQTEQVNVVYKRRGGSYGLIEPQL